MTQGSDLVKLADSKDIMELQLKQLDFEITIRKKEAIQQPIVVAPVPQAVYPSYAPPSLPVAAPAPAPSAQVAPKVPALPALAKPSCSFHPPLKCPMAGMFYRSPAPDEPPFVKVGDKVQKGQVVGIIEAMKFMNEIEARLLLLLVCIGRSYLSFFGNVVLVEPIRSSKFTMIRMPSGECIY